MRDGGYVDVVK